MKNVIEKRKVTLQERNALVQDNLRFVYYVAKEFSDKGVEYEELVSMGMEGVIKEAERFDSSLGYKFGTYAIWWIKQAIQRGIEEEVDLVRIPSHRKGNIYKVRRAYEEWEQMYGKEPTVAEAAKASGLSKKMVKSALEYMYTVVSMDALIGEDGEASLSALIADAGAENPEEKVLQKNLSNTMTEILDRLNPREARVLVLRYGFEGGKPMSLEDVEKLPEFGVTRERVRQIEAKALKKIRLNPGMMILLQAYAA